MLNKLKSVSIDERPRFSRQQRRLTGYGKKHVEKPASQNHPLQNRIAELEEEIARLSWTVKFLQDMNLSDD